MSCHVGLPRAMRAPPAHTKSAEINVTVVGAIPRLTAAHATGQENRRPTW